MKGPLVGVTVSRNPFALDDPAGRDLVILPSASRKALIPGDVWPYSSIPPIGYEPDSAILDPFYLIT